MTKKTAIVSCYFQPNYGSMLQALATQMALDKLGIENETINIDGLRPRIRNAKILYFTKAALSSDILLSKAGMAAARVRRKLSRSSYTEMMRARLEAFSRFRKERFRLSDSFSSFRELAQACEIGAMLAASVIVTTESVCPRFLPRELGLDMDVED